MNHSFNSLHAFSDIEVLCRKLVCTSEFHVYFLMLLYVYLKPKGLISQNDYKYSMIISWAKIKTQQFICLFNSYDRLLYGQIYYFISWVVHQRRYVQIRSLERKIISYLAVVFIFSSGSQTFKHWDSLFQMTLQSDPPSFTSLKGTLLATQKSVFVLFC